MRRIFLPKNDKVTEEWRRLHNKELYDLYWSPDVIQVIRLKRMRLVELVARMGTGEKVHTGFWWRYLRGKGTLRRHRCRCRKILKCIFKKWGKGPWTGFIWLRTVTGGGLL